MTNYKRLISGILALSLVMTASMPIYANKKEEVIYVISGSNGEVRSIYAVNSFDGGEITDYGEYSEVKLLTMDGTVDQSGDEISFTATEGEKVYYQGTLTDTEIPWNISIRYFLDGQEYSADDIAGKSGALEIRVKIDKNENCPGDFYENYAVQASFTLDTDICKNIRAEGATVANVGSDKQITYTALPDSGLERSLYADVTDFEMPAGSINGVRMNLGIDLDDEDLEEKINDLIDGAAELDDGAKELYDGTSELNDGTLELTDGISELRDGISTAQDGLNELTEKSSELTDGSGDVLDALKKIQESLSGISASTDQLEELVTASAQIKTGIDELYQGISALRSSVNYDAYKAAMAENGLDIDTLKAGTEQAAAQLSEQISALKKQLEQIKNVPQYAEQAAELQSQIEQLEGTLTLLKGSSAAMNGTEAYLNQVSQAAAQLESGAKELSEKYAEFDTAINNMSNSLAGMLLNMSELKSGIDELVTEYEKLDDGIAEYTNGVGELKDGLAEISDGAKSLAEGAGELADGAKELMDGAAEMSDGTAELRSETAKIDSTFSDDLSGMLDSVTNDSYVVKSFISDKNTDVSAVQFVIKTDAVEIPEPPEPEPEPEEKLSFWRKLLRLFGL